MSRLIWRCRLALATWLLRCLRMNIEYLPESQQDLARHQYQKLAERAERWRVALSR